MVTKRAVLFDLDGTLIDAYAGIHDALSHTMAALGFTPLGLDEVRRMVGYGLEHLLTVAMNADVVAQAVPIYRTRYAEIAVATAQPMPHAEALLRQLSERHVLLAIASNKPSYFSRQIVEGLGWGHFFTAIKGPDIVAAPKPDPAMIRALLAELAVEADHTLYVGDMTVDLETARAAGVRVVLVASGSMSADELTEAGAPIVVPSLGALLE